MIYKKLLTSLALVVALSACNKQNNNDELTKHTEEEISQALDDDSNDPVKTSSKDSDNEGDQTSDNAIDYEKWRNMLVEIGEFSEDLAISLRDEDIEDVVNEAKELSKETGYWDVKDFVFQELSKMYPDESYKFPLDSIAVKYDQVPSEEGELTNKYEYERRLMADWGYPAGEVWSTDDYFIEQALNIAYLEDNELYYEDYVKRAGDILFSDDEDTSDEDTRSLDDEDEDKPKKSKKKKPAIRRFGSSQTDYDAIKSALVQYYEFAPSTVNQMTNEDIDIAYTRAMDRLEETGFGDIGLIFDELGKMYPGASTMYPGEQ